MNIFKKIANSYRDLLVKFYMTGYHNADKVEKIEVLIKKLNGKPMVYFGITQDIIAICLIFAGSFYYILNNRYLLAYIIIGLFGFHSIMVLVEFIKLRLEYLIDDKNF